MQVHVDGHPLTQGKATVLSVFTNASCVLYHIQQANRARLLYPLAAADSGKVAGIADLVVQLHPTWTPTQRC